MDEMKKILAASNEKMTNKDIVDMVKEAEHEDCMDYKGEDYSLTKALFLVSVQNYVQ